MKHPCILCQLPATRAACCKQYLCDEHGGSVLLHDCPEAKRIDAIASDPAKLKAWRAENAPEEAGTTAVVAALDAMPEIEMAWQSRKRGGVRANDAAKSVADVTALSRPDGIHVEVEMKGTHKDACACGSCSAQRDRAERVRGAGGVYVAGVRKPQDAVNGVRMGLAMARARERGAA
jgi:hypothetical protein